MEASRLCGARGGGAGTCVGRTPPPPRAKTQVPMGWLLELGKCGVKRWRRMVIAWVKTQTPSTTSWPTGCIKISHSIVVKSHKSSEASHVSEFARKIIQTIPCSQPSLEALRRHSPSSESSRRGKTRRTAGAHTRAWTLVRRPHVWLPVTAVHHPLDAKAHHLEPLPAVALVPASAVAHQVPRGQNPLVIVVQRDIHLPSPALDALDRPHHAPEVVPQPMTRRRFTSCRFVVASFQWSAKYEFFHMFLSVSRGSLKIRFLAILSGRRENM